MSKRNTRSCIRRACLAETENDLDRSQGMKRVPLEDHTNRDDLHGVGTGSKTTRLGGYERASLWALKPMYQRLMWIGEGTKQPRSAIMWVEKEDLKSTSAKSM